MAEGAFRVVPEEITLSVDRAAIFVRRWRPVSLPRAVVAICHGFNAHGGLYAWVAERLVAAGCAVYAVDLRGRGRSTGPRFTVERFDDYVADIAAMIALARRRDQDLPLYLLGHGAGGVAACLYAIEHPFGLQGLICESVALRLPAPAVALALLKLFGRIAPGARVLRLKTEDFSRDGAWVEHLNADPLIAGEIQPLVTVAALIGAGERLDRDFSQLTTPVLILHGTADRATQPSGSQHFYDATGSKDKALRLYEGAYHDLLSDIGREAVIEDIVSWIAQRLPAAPHIPLL
ncbi:lysophospholipase [Sphingomonas sp. H39-1-10]|uniref:alpha/beta hydrolase n=1 Tax=Sphingomonas pollutisoli TaxID=3030829 RepID=UPI0023B9398C|nr:alpha/beta hydrolase [Sphingomonas pollutisoli]MDF0487515.1 lysophospholipase [Sphingomonas pollutisoli]